MEGESPAVLGLVAAFALEVGFAMMIGGAAASTWLRRPESSWSGQARLFLARFVFFGACVVLVAGVGDLWFRSANVAGVALAHAGPAVARMIGASHYGVAWITGMIATGVVLVCSVTGYGHRLWRLALVCTALMVVAYARSVVSHASADGDFTLAVVVDWAHLIATALWVGVVFVASVLPFDPGTTADRTDVVKWLVSLSRAATGALIVIMTTGALNTWRATGGALGSLPGSTYGTALAIKLLCVFIAITLGAHNRFQALPALVGGLRLQPKNLGALQPFIRVVRIEAFVLAAALAAAVVLSSLELPQT